MSLIMQTPPEGTPGNSAVPGGAEALLARADTALEEETLRKLVGENSAERREHLFAIGALPTASGDDEVVREWVTATFRAYNDLTPDQEETADGVQRYQELANLLCLAGIATPITFRDWKVDRVAEAEQKWGLRVGGTALLEEMLVERCAPPRHAPQPRRVHLHKGPGNGQLMHHLRSESGHMEEVGVGDRLYFTIESVLLQYVRPELRDDHVTRQTIEMLSQALQGALHEQWFEPICDEHSVVIRSQPRGHICDLNDIFPLLAHPQEWLPKIYKKMMKALYRASEEFEDDKVEMVLPHAAQDFIVQLAGCEVEYMQAKCQRIEELHKRVAAATAETNLDSLVHEFWLITGMPIPDISTPKDLSAKIQEVLRSEKAEINRRRREDSPTRKLVELKKAVDIRMQKLRRLHERKVAPSDDIIAFAMEFVGLMERVALPVGDLDVECIAAAVGEELEHCLKQSRDFKRQIAASRKREAEVKDHTQQANETSLKLHKIFTDEFALAIVQHERFEDSEYRKKKPRIDLNRSGPVMHFRQFMPGRFTSTLAEAPPNSCLLVSSSRADSHEDSTPLKDHTGLTINLADEPGEFEEDVRLTVDRLLPGGVYLTDGHRQSFTRIDRFEEIMRATEGREDIRVTLVVDKQTGVPRSVLVERELPESGFLEESDLFIPLNDGEVHLVPCDKAMRRRPDLFIERVIRRQIYAIAGGDSQAFRDCQQHIGDDLDRSLRCMATGNLARYADLIDEELLEIARRRVCEVVSGASKSEAQYGARLRNPVKASAKKIGSPSFFGLSSLLMDECGVGRDAPPEVRQKYDMELFRAMAARVCRVMHGDDASDTPLSEEELSEWKQDATHNARNTDLQDEPLLSSADVREIIRRMGQDLRARVERITGVQETLTVGSGLETFRPRYLHVAPRLGEPITRINAHSEFSIERLSANKEFGTPEMQAIEAAKIRLIRQQLLQIRTMTGDAPIQLILFQDCGTNLFLEREVRRIVGEENYRDLVANIGIRFDPKEGVDRLAVHFQAQREEKLQELAQQGVIFVVGGSWLNPDDPYGQFFQQTYGKLIHDALAVHESPARGLFICFGHQNMIDLIGEAHRGQLPEVASGPGALEFCPTPIRVGDPNHPLFKDCPSRFTLMNTHGRHVDGLDRIHGRGEKYIRPIAHSELTGLPNMCELYRGKAFSMQTHPEVDFLMKRDRERIMAEVDAQGSDIVETYHMSTGRLRAMLEEASERMQANAGPHLLTNGFLALAESIPIRGRSWSGHEVKGQGELPRRRQPRRDRRKR